MGNIILYFLLLILCIGVFVGSLYILGKVGLKELEEKKRLLKAAQEKDPSEWTETDRKVLLDDLEQYRQLLTPLQYDVLKSKYKGTKSAAQIMIEAGGNPYSSTYSNSNNISNNISNNNSTKQETKTIVKNAVAGAVVAGPAGAVVGAVVGKNKVDNQSKNQ